LHLKHFAAKFVIPSAPVSGVAAQFAPPSQLLTCFRVAKQSNEMTNKRCVA